MKLKVKNERKKELKRKKQILPKKLKT